MASHWTGRSFRAVITFGRSCRATYVPFSSGSEATANQERADWTRKRAELADRLEAEDTPQSTSAWPPRSCRKCCTSEIVRVVPTTALSKCNKVRALKRLSDYSMTSSARTSKVGGTTSPSALAVLRLITSSNFVGCCTGSSPTFAPRRMRST
jgi:hypothetical protein